MYLLACEGSRELWVGNGDIWDLACLFRLFQAQRAWRGKSKTIKARKLDCGD